MSVMNTTDPVTRPLASRRGTPGEPSSAAALMAQPAALEQPDEPQARKLDIEDARQGRRLGHQRSGG